MNVHRLNIEKQFLDAKIDGRKNFEIRNNDRDFKVGDIVVYFDIYTLIEHKYRIIYITDFMQAPGYVVFGEQKVFDELFNVPVEILSNETKRQRPSAVN